MSQVRLCSALIIVLAAAIPLSGPATASRQRALDRSTPEPGERERECAECALYCSIAQGFRLERSMAETVKTLRGALHAFQQVNGLKVGRLDQRTAARLADISQAPTLVQYTIQAGGCAGTVRAANSHRFRRDGAVAAARLPQPAPAIGRKVPHVRSAARDAKPNRRV